jgi:hypothetical protein
MFDFPTTPATGTVVTVPDGSYRVWDSQKWRAAPSANVIIPPTGFLPLTGGTLTGQMIGTQIRLGGSPVGSPTATHTFTPVPVGTNNYDQNAFVVKYNYNGTTDHGQARYYNAFFFDSDTVDVGADMQGIGLGGLHFFGGPGMTGSRSGFRYQLSQSAACAASGNYQAGLFATDVHYPSGGTDLWANSGGIIWGGAIYARATDNATNFRGVAGLEIDYGIVHNGTDGVATAASIVGLAVIRWNNHSFSPPIWEVDTAITISAQGDAADHPAGAKYGLAFFGTEWPIDRTNGRLIGAGFPVNWYSTNLLQAAHGVDFYNLDLTGTAFRSKGFSVLGSGRALPQGTVQVGGGYLSATNTTVSLDTVGSVCTGATIHAGGGGANLIAGVGTGVALIHDATGTYAYVTAVDGSGAATAIALMPNSGRSITSAIPANPVTFRVSGSPALFPGDPTTTSVLLDLTWTAPTTLALQPSGGTVQVGAGCIAANGSVATVLGSLGPVGSHTAVQEWIAIKNASGVTRYIPAF